MNETANLWNPLTVQNRIYVGNLCASLLSSLLEWKFSEYGKIFGINRKGPSYCFIEYSNKFAAEQAIEIENGSVLGGRKIIVTKVLVKTDSRKRKFEVLNNDCLINQTMNQS